MNAHLEIFDKECQTIEVALKTPSFEDLSKLSPEELANWQKRRGIANEKYAGIILRFYDIVSEIPKPELASDYPLLCASMKAIVAGYMYNYFDPMFIPTMIEGIRDDDEAAYLFLDTVFKIRGKEAVEVVLTALTKTNIRLLQTALGIVSETHVLEARAAVEHLLDHKCEDIAKEAKQILDMLDQL